MKGSLLRARLYVTGLALAAVGLAAFLLAGAGPSPGLPRGLPQGGELLTALVLVALLVAIGLPSFRTSPGAYFSLDMSAVFAAVLLLEPGVAMLVACAGMVASDLILRKQPRVLVGNAAGMMVGAGCAGLVLAAGGYADSLALSWDGRHLAFVLAAATVLASTNMITMAMMIALETGQPWLSHLRHAGATAPIAYCLKAGLGLLAAVLVDSAPWALVLLAAPGYAAYALVERQMRSRRRAEEALVRTEARLAEAQRIARLGSWEWSMDGEQMMWSDETYRIFGYEPQGCLPTRGEYLEHVHLEDRRRVRRALDAALSAGEPLDVEHQVVRPDGTQRHVHARGVVEHDGAGSATRLLGTLLDITKRKKVEEALREAEERYRTLVEQTPGVTYTQNMGDPSHTTYISPQVEPMLGLSPEEVIADPTVWTRSIHPDDRERVLAEDGRTNRTGEPFGMEYRKIFEDGRVIWVRDEAKLVRDGTGRPLYWQGFMTDITERREAEEALREAEERYRSLVEQIPAVIYIDGVDEANSAIYRSPFIERMIGYTAEELTSDPELWQNLLHPDDRERVLAENERTNETGEPFKVEYRMFAKDGSVVWVRDEAVLVRDGEGRPRFWQGVFMDATERKALEEKLSHQAYHDVLTGLPNRALFSDRLGRALSRADRRGRRVAVLFLDLDGFKRVNDDLGHASGDELLRAVASRLSACLRPHDSVARMGGDEFVLLLDEADEARAAGVAERVMEAVRAPYEVAGRGARVDASVGIALSGEGSNPDGLLRAADVAMYEAKRGGKGRYRFYEEPDLSAAASG